MLLPSMKWEKSFSEIKLFLDGKPLALTSLLILETIFVFFLFCILLLWLIIVMLKSEKSTLSIIQSRIEKNEKKMEDVLSLYCSAQMFSSLLHFLPLIIFLALCNANHPYNKLTECIMFRCASIPVWVTVCMLNHSITHEFHINLAFICIWEEDICDNAAPTIPQFTSLLSWPMWWNLQFLFNLVMWDVDCFGGIKRSDAYDRQTYDFLEGFC